MRAAIYARYSSDEQTGGESIDYQLERGREFVMKRGWSLDEGSIFIDEARSGTSTFRREKFNHMVALAKQSPPQFDVVVVWSTSRFGRNMDECAVNKAFLRKQGVEVHFVSQPLPEGHVGKLIEKIFEWTDELQSIQIGEYAFQGQKQVTQKGFHGGGKAPHGYKRVKVLDPAGKTDKDGKVVEYVTFGVVEEEAQVVRRIFSLYAAANSYRTIAVTLNEEGVPSPGGRTWDPSAVRTILLNENYTGARVWNQTRRNKKVQRGTKTPKSRDEWVITKDAHPAIIDEDLWDAVQHRRGKIRVHIEQGGGRRAAHSPHMLTGLLKCDECGANFTMSGRNRNGKMEGRYRCSHNRNRGKSVCGNSRAVNQNKIETAVLKLVGDSLLREDMIRGIMEEDAALTQTELREPEVEDLTPRIREIEKEIRNLTSAIKVGGPIEQLVDELKVCQGRKASLEEKQRETARSSTSDVVDVDWGTVAEAVKDLHRLFEVAEPAEKKELLSIFIKKIRIPRTGSALLEPNPEGLLQSTKLPCSSVVPYNGDPEGSRKESTASGSKARVDLQA
jgi:site-specific DNA recombinase